MALGGQLSVTTPARMGRGGRLAVAALLLVLLGCVLLGLMQPGSSAAELVQSVSLSKILGIGPQRRKAISSMVAAAEHNLKVPVCHSVRALWTVLAQQATALR